MAYGDENGEVIDRDGERYCFFDDEFWIWRKGLYCWIVLDDPPDFLTAINGRIAVVDETTGYHFCNCLRFELPSSGCVCGGI